MSSKPLEQADQDDFEKAARELANNLCQPLTQYCCAELFIFLRQLLSREKGFQAALKANDRASACKHAEHVMQALGDLVDNIFNQRLRDEWYGERAGLALVQTIEDALRAARQEQRHWLTKLSYEAMPKSSQKEDPPRRIIEAKAAAILAVFGPNRKGVGQDVANVLREVGFKHKRGDPTVDTVKSWMYDLEALRPDAPPSKRNRKTNRVTDRRYDAYFRAKLEYKPLMFPKALNDLISTTKRLAPRALGTSL